MVDSTDSTVSVQEVGCFTAVGHSPLPRRDAEET